MGVAFLIIGSAMLAGGLTFGIDGEVFIALSFITAGIGHGWRRHQTLQFMERIEKALERPRSVLRGPFARGERDDVD